GSNMRTQILTAALATLLIWMVPNDAEAQAADLRAKAAAAATAGNHNEAIKHYREVLAIEPQDGASHYQLAVQLMDFGTEQRNSLKEAENHFQKAAELGFQPLGVSYRLSRIYARRGETEPALGELEKLAAGGFGLINLIENEDDYLKVKDSPRFAKAVAAIRAARYPCEANPKHHDFDFWIGNWRVTQNGQFAGENRISAIMGHCLIFEQWTSASGGEGKSFNYYDPGQDRWRQIWVSDSGTFIEFSGEARDGGIFYTAETTNPADGAVTQHKFEFTQNVDGSVRQFWQTSTDGGSTWNTIWDGRYDRVEEAAL
ncbi:MAG: tetratricopeptide repeat protein, partial [Pseudomonadota bacterium]